MKPLSLALVSGVLFALALPPFNHAWLGWVALAPLLVAARGRRPLEAVGLGLLSGLTAGAIQVGWHSDTERLFWGWLPFFSLSALFGTMALTAAAPRSIPLLACLGVALEWLTTFSPLPLNIALTQSQNLPLIQIASVTGIWGVSLLLWLANAAIADAIMRRKLLTGPLAATAGAVGLALLYWLATISVTPRVPERQLTVAAIQDFSGAETGTLAPEPTGDVDRDTMTADAARNGAKIIVWSEECLGANFRPDDTRDPTVKLARALQTALVVGYSDGARPKPFNCAAWVEADGSVAGVHRKTHLYLGERQTTARGGRAAAFASKFGTVGLEICFDSCYTDVTRQLVQSGATLIAMPNYDPPTPRGVLHRLHAAMLPFRAVENYVPFVRADSNGVSQIVAADGRIVAQSPLFRPDVLVGMVALGDGRGTLFTRWGDWAAYLCLVGALGLRSGVVNHRRKNASHEPKSGGAAGGGVFERAGRVRRGERKPGRAVRANHAGV